jgi:hypothetical protein
MIRDVIRRVIGQVIKPPRGCPAPARPGLAGRLVRGFRCHWQLRSGRPGAPGAGH